MSNIFPSGESGYSAIATNQLNSASADYADSDYTDHLTGQSSMMNTHNWQRNHTVSIWYIFQGR